MHSTRQERKRSFSIQDILETGTALVEQKDQKELYNSCQYFRDGYFNRNSRSGPDGQEEQPLDQQRFVDLQKFWAKRPESSLKSKKCRGPDETQVSGKESETQIRYKDDPSSALKYLTEDICPENKRKKSRTVFSRRQIYQLETAFDTRRYLSSSERSYLAQSLDLTETQIKIWFQNRRNKWKRQWQTNGSACNNSHSSKCVSACASSMPLGHFVRETTYPGVHSFCCHGVTTETLHQPRAQCHCDHMHLRQPAYLQIPCFPETVVNWQQHESRDNVRSFYRM